jgi:hypothetical protein
MKSRLLSITGCAASLLALILLTGGHWLALQSFAWAKMLKDFSQTDSFTMAIEKTFDGRHPCPMCLKIRHGRQQEEQERRNLPLNRTEPSIDLCCDSHRTSIPPATDAAKNAIPDISRLFSDFIEAPPKPPPRGAGAAPHTVS